MADAARERREEIDDLLTSVFNSILRIEEKSLDNRFTEGLTITEIHTIDAVGYREANPMNVVASRLGVTLATFTITNQRRRSYDFSRPYYIDHIGVLVRKASGITDLAGLDGKTVGVALSATTKDKLGAAARELGITLKFAEYATYPEIKIALVAGRVDAFSVDSSILVGYQDASTYLLPTQFAPQAYGVATRKGSPLSGPIDEAIGAMEADGTLRALKERWGLSLTTEADVEAEQAAGGLGLGAGDPADGPGGGAADGGGGA